MKQLPVIGGLLVLIIGLLFVLHFRGSTQTSKLQNEIDRVANTSGIHPTAIRCRNVEQTRVCFAEYSALRSNQAKQMLVKAGYTLVDTQYGRQTAVSATNQAVKIRVDSDPTFTQGGTMTLKYRDIHVTP